jgi:serine/threonine-protein kinase
MIQVGTVLHGSYRLDRLLGKGGMGAVFQASHVRLPKQFAIKVLQAEALKNKEAYARFRREAEISSSLGHPNIVEVHDFNQTDDGEPYIVMELVEGMDLATLLARDGRLGVDRTLSITRALVSALSAVHELGVIHRDLKPQNVLVGRRAGHEIVKVLDFGISKISGNTDIQTNTASIIGTPAYMSPEQARGQSSRVDSRSDQFALGAMVYEMLSGRRAFISDGDQVMTTLYRVLNEDPAPIEDQPPAVSHVLFRAMSKEPTERYADVAVFLRTLEDAIAGRPVEGRLPITAGPLGVSTQGEAVGTTSMSSAAAEVVTIKPLPPLPTMPPVPEAKRRSGMLVGGVIAVVAVAGFAVVMRTSGRAPVPAQAPAAATATAAPAPPSRVSIRFVIRPPGAKVTIDGVPLTSPMIDLQRGSQPAALHAEADGYQPLELPVATSKDDTITVELKPKAVPAPTAAPARPAAHKSPKKPGAHVNKGEVLEDPFAN